MRELPRGWAWTTLGEIGEYLNGRGFRKHEWSKTGRPIIRIQNLTGTSSRFNYYDGDAEESYIARRGDLLVSWAATLGAYVWDGPEAVVNQHIFKVRSFIDTRFHRFLVTSVLDELQRQAHGSGMVHVTRKVFDETPVALPPLAEQQRIVAVMEEHFSGLDAAEASLGRAQRLGGQMREVVYAQAVAGDWPSVPLQELLREPLRNGHSAKASRDGTGVRTLTLTAVTQGDFSEANTKMTIASPARVTNLWLEPGDVLIERSNTPELVGTAALYRGPSHWAIFPDLLIRVRTSDQLLPSFLEVVLRARPARRYFRLAAEGIAGSMPKIDQADVEGMLVPLPPFDEQTHIVAEVERQLSLVDSLTAAIDQAQKRSAAVRRAILARAFRGELVCQDADDEPASTLLERIASQRAATTKRTRKGKVKAPA